MGNRIRQELERDKAVEARVLGLINHTHPAAAEFFNHYVVRNSPPDHVEKSYVPCGLKSMKDVGFTPLRLKNGGNPRAMLKFTAEKHADNLLQVWPIFCGSSSRCCTQPTCDPPRSESPCH